MKTLKNNLLRFIALGLALTASLTFMASCGKKSPLETLESGIRTLAENVSDDYAVINTLADAAHGGSVQVNVNLDEIIKEAADMEIENVDGSLTVFFGDRETMVNTAAKLNGVAVADANIYMDDEGFAISSDAFFGEGVAYGSAYEGMDERFDKSIFAPGEAYGEVGDAIGDVVDYLSYTGRVIAMRDDFANVMETLKGDIYKAIEENTETSLENGTYSADSGEIKTHNVTVIAKDEQIADTAEAIINILIDSDDFKNFCDDHRETISEMFDVEDPITELKEVRDELNDSRDDLENCEFELFAAIGRSTGELVALKITLDSPDEEELEVEIEIAPSSAELRSVNITVSEGSEKAEIEYTVKESTKNAYSSKLTFKESTEDLKVELFDYSWNKSSGDFKLDLYDDSITLKGSIEADKKESVINITEIASKNDEFKFDKLEIVIKASDTMPPAIDDYKDILTVTESEFEAIIGDVEEVISSYLSN